MEYMHEYDEKGNHRLGTRTKSKNVRWGKWAPYTGIAMLGQYAAVTNYYAGTPEFPNEFHLYRIQKNVWPLTELPRKTEPQND